MNMKTNYHAHTYRCGHAEADERAYVEAAIREGFKIFGFADHVPQPYPNGFRSGMRIQPEDTGDYVRTIVDLKQEFGGEIDLHVGFEAEYFPTMFNDMLRLLEPHPYEYLVLGQHCLDREDTDHCHWSGWRTEDKDILRRYVDQCAEGLNTGAFSCFVHPDVIHYTGDESIYRAEMRRLCREAKGCGVPVEFNLLGYGTHRHYPTRAFWEEAAVVGNKVILGWDAHAASWLKQPQMELDADAYLRELGLQRIETLTLVRPRA